MSDYSILITVDLVKHDDDGSEKQPMLCSCKYNDLAYEDVVAIEGCVKAMTDGLYGLGLAKLEQKKSGK